MFYNFAGKNHGDMKIALAMAMKRWRHGCMVCLVIGMTLWVACTPSAQVVEPAERPSEELSAIDSLMWRQPDSAFAQLRQFVASPQADSLDEFNVHYCQLLISELLYKNYCGQSNREELLRAVAYFDSLTIALNDNSQPRNRHCGLDPQSPDLNDNPAFLDARAHYINGVGYYERDSVVEACKEYLKALEVMEAHFEEKELVGHRARFMTYIYNRLMELFSGQFMMEPAIVCGEKALEFCRIAPTSPTAISNILSRLGLQYDKIGDKEKMREYYIKAFEEMPDSNNLSYRNLTAIIALSDYQSGMGIEPSIHALRKILSQANDNEERLTRFLTIGTIFFIEGISDSALVYLKPVFESDKDISSKIQAAEYLHVLYENNGDSKNRDECIRFLIQQKKAQSQNNALVSELGTLFHEYTNKSQQRKTAIEKTEENRRLLLWSGFIGLTVAFVMAVAIFFFKRNNEKQKDEHTKRLMQEKERQIRLERKAHQEETDTLQRDVAIREAQIEALERQSRQQTIEKASAKQAFLNEMICRNMMDLVTNLQLSTRSNYSDFPEVWISKENISLLGEAVSQHFPNLKTNLKAKHSKMDWKDTLICYLSMIGLTEAQIAVVLQLNSTTVYRRVNKMRQCFDAKESLADFLWDEALCQKK